MDLNTNSELIQLCLIHLKLKKEEFVRNYKPTDWELLTPSEQTAVSKLRTQLQENKTLEEQIALNHVFRRYKAWLRTQKKNWYLDIKYNRNPSPKSKLTKNNKNFFKKKKKQ